MIFFFAWSIPTSRLRLAVSSIPSLVTPGRSAASTGANEASRPVLSEYLSEARERADLNSAWEWTYLPTEWLKWGVKDFLMPNELKSRRRVSPHLAQGAGVLEVLSVRKPHVRHLNKNVLNLPNPFPHTPVQIGHAWLTPSARRSHTPLRQTARPLWMPSRRLPEP